MKRNAFSLIEVLIASLIFILVMAAGSASFIGSTKTASKTKVAETTVEQARFAMEAIVRQARLAKNYQITSSNALSITDAQGATLAFALENGVINSSRAGQTQPLTSAQEVRVTNLSFSSNTSSSSQSATVAPYVSIEMTVEPAQAVTNRPETQNPYSLKTTVGLGNFKKY